MVNRATITAFEHEAAMSDPVAAPTAKDVARLARISKTTVSYVLSGRRSGASRISDETRLRVLEAARSLGYVPDSSARALRRRRTDRVCLVIPRLGVPYYDLLARDLQRAAASRGYSLVVAVNDGPQPSVIDQLRRRMADGAVFVSESAGDVREVDLAGLAGLNIAVVALSDSTTAQGFDVVHSDASKACEQAVAHLAARGHDRIAFMGHFLPGPRHYGRYEAYVAGLRACRLRLDERLVVTGAIGRTEAYHSAQELIRRPDRPTAIFAASDIAAVSVVWAAREAGLRVPDDLAVIGVGNIPEDAVVYPPLTSVGPKSAASGQIAELLFSRLNGEAPAEGRTYVQEWELVLRQSA